MSNFLKERAESALDNLDTRLKNYAAAREFEFVGQFLDEEGCANDQHGIYGMGAWVALTESNDAIKHQPNVKKLSDACKTELRRLVAEAEKSYSTDPKVDGLKIVVPKLCYAYLGIHSKYPTEANQLAARIANAQKADNSWGFLTNSPTGCPEITSLVVRTFATHPSLRENIKNALVYLRTKHSSISNHFLRLDVLNTLLVHDADYRKSSEYRRLIKKVVRTLLNQAFFNPTRFPNPINLDFNDGQKTRYIRLETDIILLDSLQKISGPHELYARGHPGRRVYLHVIETLKVPPIHDTTGHRLSPFSALHLRNCLSPFLGAQRWEGLLGWIESAWAYLVCAWTFGFNLEWNLLSLGFCLLGFFVSRKFAWTIVEGPFIGAGIKACLDLGRSLYNAWTRFANE